MRSKYCYFAGIDEVGRGPIAGPVTVCALVLTTRRPRFYRDIKDSKKLTPRARERWFTEIKKWRANGELNYVVASASNNLIDRIGINRAVNRCINRALGRLSLPVGNTLILLDGGLKAPDKYWQQTIIRGDEKEAVIALASIVAKVTRDRRMVRLERCYPGYGFSDHKGYGTQQHYRAIKQRGLQPIHRQSFLVEKKP